MTTASFDGMLDLERRGRLHIAPTTKVRGLILTLTAHEPLLGWSKARALIARELGSTMSGLLKAMPTARRMWINESARAYFSTRQESRSARRRMTACHISKNGRRIVVWLKDGSQEVWARRSTVFDSSPSSVGRSMTIYTWGYGGRSVEELGELRERFSALIVATRYVPRSRRPEFNRRRLER